MENLIDIKSLFPEEIKEILVREGIEGYRAGQIFSWLYKGADSFEEMTNLSKELRARLGALFYIEKMRGAERLSSRLDETKKYLFTLSDGEYVESVLLSYKHGYSVCLSTQVGCKMGCAFCASTKAGFSRHLKPSEILNQMDWITRDRKKEDPDFRISHVVLMGIGEPLDNYENVIRFLRLVNRKEGFGIGFRNVSLSTCGLVDRIYDLAKEDMPITLSISLHASNDATRSALMPVNRKYPLPQLMQAAKDYTKITGRRISFEYTLIAGVNDSAQNAKELAMLMKGWLNHVNLIPVNPTRETDFRPGSKKNLQEWIRILEKEGVRATLRRTLGADISAACGQLRREKLAE